MEPMEERPTLTKPALAWTDCISTSSLGGPLSQKNEYTQKGTNFSFGGSLGDPNGAVPREGEGEGIPPRPAMLGEGLQGGVSIQKAISGKVEQLCSPPTRRYLLRKSADFRIWRQNAVGMFWRQNDVRIPYSPDFRIPDNKSTNSLLLSIDSIRYALPKLHIKSPLWDNFLR